MKKILQAIVCLLFSALTSAQTGKINGKIINAANQPVDAVLIALHSASDDALLKTTFSESDGRFEFSSLPDNNYTVVIEDSNYKLYRSEVIIIKESGFQLQEIKLQSVEKNELLEVVIQKKKPFVEQKIDRTVVNVDAMISNAGADAMEVLEKSPGILVDQNGTITFRGKSGVAVFIDDKPTYLSGADLEAYLKSLPASTLNQIEFMTNPPAKYDAAGSGGVINIKTKKSKAKGFNGSISSRVSEGKKGMNRNSLNLNYTNGKIRLYGNAGFAAQETITDLYIFRRYKNEDQSTKTLFYQNTLLTGKSTTANAKIGLDYYVSDKTTLGVSFTGLSRSGNNKSMGSSEFTNADSVLDSTIVADNNENKKFKNGGVTLNYSREFNGGKVLTADADFLNYSDKTSQRYRNYIYRPDNSLSSSDESQGELPSKISIYTLKTDYVNPLKNEASFDTGYKVSFSKTDNVADYSDIIGGNAIPNPETSNHFKYDEIIHAAYFNFNKSYKRFSFQAGLRLESTISKGNQLMEPVSRFERNYTNLFPTAYAMYKLDSIGNNSLVVSYGKRINRPYYQDLNPFLSPLDKFTFYSGNPYLNPAFAHNVELSYRYTSIFSTTLSYSKSKDEINETIEIRNGIYYYSRPGNIGKSQYLTLNAQSDFSVTKWLAGGIYAEVTHTDYESDLYTEGLDAEGTFFSLSGNTRFTIDKSWSAEMIGRYTSEITSSQFTLGALGTINLAIQKKIFHDQGTLKLAVNDIFYTGIRNGVINNLKNTDATWKNKPDSRFVALTFVYSFGKSFQSKSRERSGAEEEQNRVKN